VNPRVIALCVCGDGDRILCFEGTDATKDETFYRPLGGGVEWHERAEDAVVREMKEEIGADLTDVRLLGVLENIFSYRGEEGHEIAFVFDGRFADASLYERDDLVCREETVTWPARWMHLNQFVDGALPLYPDGLLELLTGPK